MITRELIGKNLKAMREHVNMKHQFVADSTGLSQKDISYMENGKEGSGFGKFLTLINFYAKNFDMTHFFSEAFYPLEKDDIQPKISLADKREILDGIINDLQKLNNSI